MHIGTITDLDPMTSHSNTDEQMESTKMTMYKLTNKTNKLILKAHMYFILW